MSVKSRRQKQELASLNKTQIMMRFARKQKPIRIPLLKMKFRDAFGDLFRKLK